ALPSTTGPWSEAELSAMLTKIDPSKLDSSMKALYDELDNTLNGTETMAGQDKGIKSEFSFDLNLEMYLHTNTDTSVFRYANSLSTETVDEVVTETVKINGVDATIESTEKVTKTKDKLIAEYPFRGVFNWQYNELKQKPLFGIRWDAYVDELFYSHFELELRNSFHAGDLEEVGGGYNEYKIEFGYANFASNILFLQGPSLYLGIFDGNAPYRAFVSMGSGSWSMEIGRDRISWGAGVTGNLAVSDNLLYHNMVRFTAFSNNYKYTFLMSFFPHSQNYYNDINKSHWSGYDKGTGGYFDGIMMYMAHRVEGRFLNDKLNLTATEAIMYKQPNGTLDFKFLNPVMFYHNYFIPYISNSTLVFEADYTPIKHLNIYGQFIIDEIAFPGLESSAGPSNKSTPSGNGFILGVKTSFALNGGVFHGSAEVAKTDPYLYLRDAKEANNYNLNYVVPLRIYSPSTDIIFTDKFLGYTYGPDAVVFDVKAGWELNKFKIEGSVFYMLHGTHDQWTQWTETGGEGQDAWDNKSTTPTSVHESVNNKYDDAQATRDSVSKTLIVGLNASYEFTQSLSAFVQADFISIVNWNNVSSNPVQRDFQVALGGSWKF
ncbi:MAG: hypothetical protein HUK24_01860, partial [Sphaerochaetaceae bacterium]|nr:hypothetical protein [Sphaerochaetaceae bacterium]